MNKLFTFIILLIYNASSLCQVSNDWIFANTGIEDDRIRNMVLTADGDVLVAGYYEGSLTLGDTTYIGEDFGHSGFVAKISSGGDLLWSKEYHAANFGEIDIFKILLNPAGGFYLAGSIYSREIDVDPSPEQVLLTADGDDMFIGSYDDEGNFVDAKKLTFAADSDERILDMDVDEDGNLYGVGYYDISESGNDDNMVLFSLSSIFEVLWVYSATPEGRLDGISRVEVEGDFVYVSGEFEGEADFDPSNGELILESNEDESAAFIAKLSTGGELVWAHVIKGDNDVVGRSIVVDGLGDVYVGGDYGMNTDFDPGVGEENGGIEFTDSFTSRPYVLKLDTDGNFVWVWTHESLADVYRLALDPEGGVYFGGNGQATFFGKLSADGDLSFMTELAYDDSPNSSNANLKGFAYDGNGSLILGVDYVFGFQYDPLEQKVIETSSEYDFAVAKYNIGITGVIDAPEEKLEVYPNPFSDEVIIYSNNHAIESIDVFDLYGRKVARFSNLGKYRAHVSFDGPTGNYFARVRYATGHSIVKISKM